MGEDFSVDPQSLHDVPMEPSLEHETIDCLYCRRFRKEVYETNSRMRISNDST
jgi:hypothetical protein